MRKREKKQIEDQKSKKERKVQKRNEKEKEKEIEEKPQKNQEPVGMMQSQEDIYYMSQPQPNKIKTPSKKTSLFQQKLRLQMGQLKLKSVSKISHLKGEDKKKEEKFNQLLKKEEKFNQFLKKEEKFNQFLKKEEKFNQFLKKEEKFNQFLKKEEKFNQFLKKEEKFNQFLKKEEKFNQFLKKEEKFNQFSKEDKNLISDESFLDKMVNYKKPQNQTRKLLPLQNMLEIQSQRKMIKAKIQEIENLIINQKVQLQPAQLDDKHKFAIVQFLMLYYNNQKSDSENQDQQKIPINVYQMIKDFQNQHKNSDLKKQKREKKYKLQIVHTDRRKFRKGRSVLY